MQKLINEGARAILVIGKAILLAGCALAIINTTTSSVSSAQNQMLIATKTPTSQQAQNSKVDDIVAQHGQDTHTSNLIIEIAGALLLLLGVGVGYWLLRRTIRR